MSRWVLTFEEIGKDDVASAGGKGANLGEMTAAGIAVPQGFVVTTESYREFMRENNLVETVQQALAEAGDDESRLLAAAEQFRALIRKGQMPAEVEAAIREAYAGQNLDRVAVRSSATAEDLTDASFAGQQETYLNVRGIDAVLDRVRDCYASLWGGRAVCYRRNHGYDQTQVALACWREWQPRTPARDDPPAQGLRRLRGEMPGIHAPLRGAGRRPGKTGPLQGLSRRVRDLPA